MFSSHSEADPGFQRSANPKWSLIYYSAKISRKLKENEERWAERDGMCSNFVYVDPPLTSFLVHGLWCRKCETILLPESGGLNEKLKYDGSGYFTQQSYHRSEF